MSEVAQMVERSGDLKRELIDFAQQPKYHDAFFGLLESSGFDLDDANDTDLIPVLDRFALQHRLDNGDTIVERFVAARPDLDDIDREMLLGWRDVVEGFFVVLRHDGDVLVVENLVDDLTYRVRSNLDPRMFRQLRRRSFIVTRLVPVGDEWLISGTVQPIDKRQRDAVHKAAAELALRQPAFAFRNPDKLEQAWEMQRSERDRFIRHFGADMVVIPGSRLRGRMRDFYAFSRQEILAGLAERGKAAASEKGPLPEFDYPPELVESASVATIYDELEGLTYLAEYGNFARAFEDPSLADQLRYRDCVLAYLEDDSVSTLPFRRMAEQDPRRTGEVLGRVLRKSDFDWRRDGDELMRRYKPSCFDRPMLPRTVPLSDRLAGTFQAVEP